MDGFQFCLDAVPLRFVSTVNVGSYYKESSFLIPDLNRELAVAKGVCEAGAELCFDKDNHTSGAVGIGVEGNVLIICDSELFGVFSFCKNKDIWGSIRE